VALFINENGDQLDSSMPPTHNHLRPPATMPISPSQRSLLAQALAQAQQALYLSDPNPRVGCVLVGADGALIGQGHTQQIGGPHAEVMALRDASANHASVQGATAYVTLEPCSHHGRTGPCCDALIAAGISRVVATLADPNPRVAGQGFARLGQAGVDVVVLPPEDPLARQSLRINIGFFSRMVRKTPWVRMKIAGSLDGKTALPNGQSQWITGPAARADGHAWRARASAVLTGIGTVLQDRPRLDVRQVETSRQPHLVVLDSTLQTPLDSPIFLAGRQLLIYCAVANSPRQAALAAQGAQVICLPCPDPSRAGAIRVDLRAMLHDLAQRDINEVHVEAGHTLNGALVEAGLVDELLLYLAPKLLGQGRDMAHWGPLHSLDEALNLELNTVEMVGPDLRILATVAGRDTF
jgi:diaminohydroxyphosphoribosylaminopyrimidine deaminase/5-amino-6-(5-phosphoribosylamino)uracil reductase